MKKSVFLEIYYPIRKISRYFDKNKDLILKYINISIKKIYIFFLSFIQ